MFRKILRRNHFGGDEDEIIEIPALDEEEEEDITKQVQFSIYTFILTKTFFKTLV